MEIPGKNGEGIATVVKHTGSHYVLSPLPHWSPFNAVLRGKLKLKGNNSTNPIAVGDRVEYEFENIQGEQIAAISKIFPRKNYIIRKSTNLSKQSHIIASNLDMVFLVVTIMFPEVKLPFVDRFLVTCEAYHIPVTILVNKADLYTDEMAEANPLGVRLEHFTEIYTKAGYRVIPVSAHDGTNIDVVREMSRDKVVLFSGVSGVGKSSLINALDPSLELKTGAISAHHLQGRHTTTFYQMHPLAGGGFVVDTPGIRGFGLVDFTKDELSTYFPDMVKVMDSCKFAPCTHTHEPGCAVKAAVEAGEISPERYESYLGMLEEETKYR